MFKQDSHKFLVDFVSNHSNLNDSEKEIISKTISRLNDKHVSQYREVGYLTHELQNLSLDNKLSTDGLLLMKQLHQQDWFMGLLFNTRLF